MDGSVCKIADYAEGFLIKAVAEEKRERLWQIQIVTAVQIMYMMTSMNVIVVWSIWTRMKCIDFYPAVSGSVHIIAMTMNMR